MTFEEASKKVDEWKYNRQVTDKWPPEKASAWKEYWKVRRFLWGHIKLTDEYGRDAWRIARIVAMEGFQAGWNARA